MPRTLIIAIILSVTTLSVYWRTGTSEFINFDDDQYVYENSYIQNGLKLESVRWAMTATYAANWHPVTWLSHMADVQLYGMNPRGHHLTNVIIHTVSSLLLLFLLYRCTGSFWQSSFVAALFALHPLHVQSVAWVAERKDVLSAFFCFLTLLLYCNYTAKKSAALYVVTLLAFLFGLMTKPMLVTLPLVMLLMDFWPLNRYRFEGEEFRKLSATALSLVKEKIPFFACSLFSSIITVYAQNTGSAIRSIEELSYTLRIENALTAYIKYIVMTFWPNDLAILYPVSTTIPSWQVIGSLLVLLLFSVVSVRCWRRYPYIPVGWFWFLITLLPVIGLIQVGAQSIADRYTYIPLIGIFIVTAWGATDLTSTLQYRKEILALITGVVIITSTAVTWQQLGYWQDSISLYRQALKVTSGNSLINFNLALALEKKGKTELAIQEYRNTLQINPNYSEAHTNLGAVLFLKGDIDQAMHEYQEGIRINPNDMQAHNNLGIALARKGNVDAAIREYQEALRINPNYAKARKNLYIALTQKRMQAENGK